MRGDSSDRASTAGEAGTVSKRRQESLEKHAGGTKLGARQMRIRKVKRGGAKQRRSERMGGGGGGMMRANAGRVTGCAVEGAGTRGNENAR